MTPTPEDRARRRRALLEEVAQLRALRQRVTPRRTRRALSRAALLQNLHRL